MIKQETPVKQERRERLEDADYDALCNFLEENGAKVYYGIASDTFKNMDEVIFECDSQERAFEIGDLAANSGYPLSCLLGIWRYRGGKRRASLWRLCV